MMRFAFVAAAMLGASPACAATIHVIEHATSDATAAIGKAKDNRGDVLTFANPLFDAADKTQVGSDNGFCIRTAVGKSYECQWTTTLADGQLTVEGPFHDAGDTVLAVTGGTGKYTGARGSMALHARDKKSTEYDFVFSLQ